MPLYNSYNLEVANQLAKMYQDKVNHENLYNDNLEGGSGFAADYHLDSGFQPTLGATSTMHPVVSSTDNDCSDFMEGEGKRKYKRKGKGMSAGEKPMEKIVEEVKKTIKGKGMSAGKQPTTKEIEKTVVKVMKEGDGISAGAKPKKRARKKGGDFNDILDGVSKVANTAKDVAEAVAPVAGVVAPLLALGKPKRKARKKGGASLENPSREPYRDGGQSDIPSGPLTQHAPSANKFAVLEAPVERSQMPGVSVGGSKKTISEKMKRRNELIKKIMKERNCTLPRASKIIAEEKMQY